MKLSIGKKKKAAAPDKKKSPRSGVGLGTFSLINFIAVAVITYLCVGGLFVLQGQLGTQKGGGQVQEVAEGLATRLSAEMSRYRKSLSSVATDPQLADLFAQEDEGALLSKEKELARFMSEALRIRLLPKGWNELDADAVPPLSYASLDILRVAERTKKVSTVEAHQFGTKGQHIALAAPVLSADGEVVGVIHAAYPANLLRGLMDAVPQYYGGRVELQQVAGDTPLELAVNTDARSMSGPKSGGMPVSGTLWEIAYWQPEAKLDLQTLLIFFGVASVGLVLIGVVFFLQTRRLKGLLQKDQGSVIRFVEAVIKGNPAPASKAHIAEFSDTLGLLDQIGQKAARGRKRVAPKEEKGGIEKEEAEDAGMPSNEPTPSSIDSRGIQVDEDEPPAPSAPAAAAPVVGGGKQLSDAIFRAYDIRGVVGEAFSREVVYEMGRAIGSEAYDQGQQTVIVARDGRISSPELCEALCKGLQDSGRDVLDVGMVPSPVLYFATHFLGSNSGVMLTGSHNPPEYNGLKIVINGEAWSGKSIQKLRDRVENGDFLQGEGGKQAQDLLPDYIGRITGDVQLVRPLKVVVDCGNGVAGAVAPALLRALGCEVAELFCEVDGDFPNHHPDPGRPENLESLISTVQAQNADLGVAFDGDGDRLGVVDSNGSIIWPDRLLMLFAADVLARQPGGDILYDVKSTRNLASHIVAAGGRPLMWKTGHSLMKSKMKETGALLAGEMSGHIFFKERWYGFDDALYACARLLEILSGDTRSSAEVFAELPDSPSTPELIMPMAEGAHLALVAQLKKLPEFPDEVKRIKVDGLRVEFQDGWGLVRASNTQPAVTFRFEADDVSALERIQELFRQQLSQVDPQLSLPF